MKKTGMPVSGLACTHPCGVSIETTWRTVRWGMPEPPTLKISVLVDGVLLLDGLETTLAELGRAMDMASKDTIIWYYRGNPTGDPPTVALAVMKLVTAHRLQMRLSSKPDFSDTVMPATAGMEKLFAPIREKAALGNLVVLRPNGQYLVMPAMPRESAPPEAVATVEKLMPSNVKRNIAVVGDTSWTMAATPNLQTAQQAIPFFGLLMGFATIGHAVWVVGPSTDLAGACRLADVLIVDSDSARALPPRWIHRAKPAMRTPQILVHDRTTYRLRAVE